MMQERIIPDVVGLKLPAAVALLDAAGVSYTEEKLEPPDTGRKKKAGKTAPNEAENDGQEGKKEEKRPEYLRVLRQRRMSEREICLTVCSVPE